MIIIGSQEVRQRWVWQLNYHSKLLCQSSQGYKKEVIWIQRIHFCVSFCFIVFTPSTMHKTFRHNIVHFSLLKTITISECLKIVFDAVFFSSVFNFRLLLLALGKLFFPARQPWWHVHIGLVWPLVLPCTTFLCLTRGYRTGISLPVYWLFLCIHHSWGSCCKKKRLCWVKN